MMIRRVHLCGPLKRFHPEPIELSAHTAAHAIELVSFQCAALQPDARGRKRVKVKGVDAESGLHAPAEMEDLYIWPAFAGAKDGGVLQVIVGAVLVVVGVVLEYVYPGNAVSSYLIEIGIAMIIGGIIQMLMPTPETDDDDDKSSYLGTPENTVAIGTRIPIVYGRRQVGFHYLAFDIDAAEVIK
jgi:predicted phage tail protein